MPRVKLFDQQEVLQKATDLFWKQGYHATSMQDLVTHLGINRASLYDTYGGKKSLFLQALTWYQSVNHAQTKDFLHQHQSVKTGLQKLLASALQECSLDKDRKGCFIVNTATELIPGDDDIKNIIADNNTQFEKILHDYLQTGVQSGEINAGKDLKAIASLLYTTLSGLRVVTKASVQKKKLELSLGTLLSLLD
ncbi:MAG: TetR/AcrR family transcriptional regulator [Saprospiraceae bacterium]